MNLVEQLTNIYLYEETHYAQEKKLSKEEADKHHRDLLDKERILVEYVEGRVAGYVEFFLEHGCVFINDLFIRPEFRRSKIIWLLRRRLFNMCGKSKVYFGDRNKFGERFPEIQLRREV